MSRTSPSTRARACAWHGFTDRGKVRLHNEDSFIGICFDDQEVMRLGKFGQGDIKPYDYAFAVSDGVGGSAAGEYASRIAVEKIMTLLPRAFRSGRTQKASTAHEVLKNVFNEVHKALRFLGESYEEIEGMEATLSVFWVSENRAHYAHIGDSRIYQLPSKARKARQLSEDDTHLAWLLRNNKITPAEALWHPGRKVLQKALGGTHQFVEPQVGSIKLNQGDTLMLCSDGLIEGLEDGKLASYIRGAYVDRQVANPAQLLVEQAVRNSGSDNTTALLIQVL